MHLNIPFWNVQQNAKMLELVIEQGHLMENVLQDLNLPFTHSRGSKYYFCHTIFLCI